MTPPSYAQFIRNKAELNECTCLAAHEDHSGNARFFSENNGLIAFVKEDIAQPVANIRK
jgi:hypothetical protein